MQQQWLGGEGEGESVPVCGLLSAYIAMFTSRITPRASGNNFPSCVHVQEVEREGGREGGNRTGTDHSALFI